jgi:glycolate oxidase iron-sulfur subunit
MKTSNNIFHAFDDQDKLEIDIISDCVHCGFCLPSCPTYVETRNELDSPRGRIYLMKSAVEGKIPMDESFVSHIDLCLGCLACQTACPSGVKYSSLIEKSRSQIDRRYKRDFFDKTVRDIIFKVFPYKHRLKLLIPILLIYKYTGLKYMITRLGFLRLLPLRLQGLFNLTPDISFKHLFKYNEKSFISPDTKYNVALLTGCVQSVFFPQINTSTMNVLKKLGCNIDIPKNQGCCGALSLHSGRLEEARAFARNIIDQFSINNYDAIIINSAGCGSSIKEYFELLKYDELYAEKAKLISSKTKDILEFVFECDLPDKINAINLKVTYQDACHIAHGQGIKTIPRELLQKIPGLQLIELTESDMCCGSAGIYNLTEQDMSQKLLNRKISNLMHLDVDYVVAGNPGCLLQIQSGLRNQNLKLNTCHPIELIDKAIQ